MTGRQLLRRITSHPDFLALVAVFFFAWLAAKPLFGSGYFNMHDDLQMMRQLNMEKCFIDGQIPCRWIPDMGYGYGYPLFNFYPPLPYLTGQLFRIVGYSYADTAKALFIVAFIASGVTMYYLAKRFFGRLGGVVSSIFYVWAPYHAVDVYVRGAMNESWGLIWFPLILLFAYNVLSLKSKKWVDYAPAVIGLSLSWFALMTSHNLMVIVFTPFFAVWCAIWLLYSRNWKSVLPLITGGALAIGLSAFFSLPVLFEKNIVQTDTLVRGYYEFTAHFPSLRQLFISRFWGYGPSVWLENDEMSFQIGWFHWGIPLFVALILAVRTIKTKKFDAIFWAILGMGLTAAGAAFMDHPRSTPIWQQFTALQFIQFPWRYLTMVILGTSFVAGGIAALLKSVPRYLIVTFSIIAVVAYSWSFFLPQNGKLGPLTDEEKFTGAAWELQQTAGIYDYLPATAKTAPKAPRRTQADILEGKGVIEEGRSGTNWEEFKVVAETPAIIRISVLDFPEWKVFVNGNEVEKFIPETEEWGRIHITVPKGDNKVTARLYDTPVRTFGNILSLFSWVTLLVLSVYLYKKRETA